VKTIIVRGLRKAGLKNPPDLGPLFDARQYRARNPDLSLTEPQALAHYREHGWREGRSPSMLFDVAWYLAQNADIASAGIEPATHYLERGWRERRDPSPLFSTAWYLATNRDVARAGVCPLAHYLTEGWQEGRRPSPWFDPKWYAAKAMGARPDEVDPLSHYLMAGWRRGYQPNLLFDPKFYLEFAPDVRDAGLEPLTHYVTAGRREGRRTHPLFDPLSYQARHPDVANAGQDPLAHCLLAGLDEGRDASLLFDAQRYLAMNPDVRANGLDALRHYLSVGWREGRSPNDWFETDFYLGQTPKLKFLEIGDPLSHFAAHGWLEGRSPCPGFDVAGLREAMLAGEDRFENLVGKFMIGGPLSYDLPEPGSKAPVTAEKSAEPATDRPVEPAATEAETAGPARAEPENPYGHAFDATYYRASLKDVRFDDDADALRHYLAVGRFAGRDPHPLFNVHWYRHAHDDLRDHDGDLFAHWLQSGWKEGRAPSALFSPLWYRTHNRDVPAEEPLGHYTRTGFGQGLRATAWFDADWYLEQDGALPADMDPLVHYLTAGWRVGRSPNHLFCPRHYLDANPDVAGADMEPMRHYLENGSREGRSPHPLFDVVAYRLRHARELKGAEPMMDALGPGLRAGRRATLLFDPVARAPQEATEPEGEADALRAYLGGGWRKGSPPNGWLDPAHYASQRPPLTGGRAQEPLRHFRERGWREGRSPSPSFDLQGFAAEWSALTRHDPDGGSVEDERFEAVTLRWAAAAEVAKSRMEDAPVVEEGSAEVEAPDPVRAVLLKGMDFVWYQSLLKGKERTKAELVDHYLTSGHAKGLNPHPLFDTRWYGARNPDVTDTGSNPFAHFLLTGAKEGRRPCPGFDLDHYRGLAPEAADHDFGPWGHFVEMGSARGLSPSPLFHDGWYKETNPDAATFSGGAFAHYLNVGWKRSAAPHPCFDPDWYRQQIVDARLDVPDIEHYSEDGWRTGASPHPAFDEVWYRATYLKDQDWPGLSHYLVHGWGFDLHPHPLFDAHFYRAAHPNLREPAFLHYLRTGEATGAKPCAKFSPLQYRARYGDLIPEGMSPFVHFVTQGDAARLSPSVEFRSERYWSRFLSYTGEFEPFRHYMFSGRHYLLEAPEDGKALRRNPAAWLEAQEKQAEARAHAGPPVVVVLVSRTGSGVAGTMAKHLTAELAKRGPDSAVLVTTAADLFETATAARAALSPAIGPGPAAPPPAAHVVIVASEALMAVRDALALADALDTPSRPRLAFPLTLDGNLDVAAAGMRPEGLVATARALGGDPDHPTLRLAEGGLIANGPAFAMRLDDLEADAATLGVEGGVTDWARALSAKALSEGRATLYAPQARAVIRNPDRKPAWRMPKKLTRVKAGKKLLFIDSLITMPDRDAGSYYALTLMRMYQSWGYAITFCPDADYMPDPHYVEALEAEGITVMRWPFVGSTASYIEATRERFDVVLMSRVHSGGAHLERARAKWPDALLVFHPGDLHYLREKREAILNEDVAGFAAAIETRKREQFLLAQADMTVLVSEFELDVLKREGLAERAVVIAPEYQGEPGAAVPYDPRDRDVVAFIGGYRHAPNVDAAEFLVNEVWPLVVARAPKMKLEIVGSDPPESFAAFKSKSVKVVGFVPSIGEYLRTVRLTVAPVRYGAGIKMKLIASLEAGVPCVATPVAAEGIGMEEGEGYVVAEEAAALADRLVALFNDKPKLIDLSRRARGAIKARYSAKAVHASYRQAFDLALARKAATQTSEAAAATEPPPPSSDRAKGAKAVRSARGVAARKRART
jgi:glycosyltransferase involved in cell wall biosynthesis